jgi:hypothetical protein
MEHQTTIIDLRGSDSSSSGEGFGVLADSTGRRRRGLRRTGRAVAVLFAIWLAALALAGLGLLPGVGIPLASRAGAGADGAPPPIDDSSPLVAGKGTRPALAHAATATAIPAARAAPTSARGPAPSRRRSVTRRRNVARERNRTAATAPATTAPVTTRAAATPAPSRPATPPGQTVIAPGHSGTAPGQTRPAKTPAPTPTPTPTPIHGKSDSAPGRSGR